MTERGKFIALEGLDGAGKTTTSKRLAELLSIQGKAVVLVERTSSRVRDDYLRKHMEALREAIYDCYTDLDCPTNELGNKHWLYLMTAWFYALDRSIVQPFIAESRHVIVDGWFYKLLCRFSLKEGMDKAHLEACFTGLTIPDYVIFLDIDPTVAASRKTSFTYSESGHFDGWSGRTSANFIQYQTLVREEVIKLRNEKNWSTIRVDNLTIDEVVNIAADDIMNQGLF
jgi:thymidylate kinase